MIDINKYADDLIPVLIRYSINTRQRICHFLAQIDHESGGLRRLTENLNYSTEALLLTFSRQRISAEDCSKYGRRAGQKANQEMIANIIYGGAWGARNLGNTTWGDGWKYRGRGPLQCTGKKNYNAYGRAVKTNLIENPDQLATLPVGLDFAGWYWESNLLNTHADQNNIKGITKIINGGYHGLDHRVILLDRYKAHKGIDLLLQKINIHV